MKRISLLIIVLITLAVSSASQERETSMAELSPRILRTISIQKEAPFIFVTETERFDKKGGRSLDKTKIVKEVVSSSTQRSITDYPGDKSRPMLEHISVDGVHYRRIGAQAWTLITGVFTDVNSAPTGVTPVRRVPIECKQTSRVFFLGDGEVNGKKAIVYEIRISVSRTYSGGEIAESITNMRYWFAENGALLKRFDENIDPANQVYAVTTANFSYDNLNIKIEVPILETVEN